MGKTLTYQIKKMINKLHVHRDSEKKDIFIFSSFRSGSTWLTQMLRSQQGVKFPIPPEKISYLSYLDEEYDERFRRPYFIRYRSEETRLIKKYIHSACSGDAVYSRRYRDIFSYYHNFITNRSIFRLLRSNYLASWYRKKFDIRTIFLLRHPLATSVSRWKIWLNSGYSPYWGSKHSEILDSNFVQEHYLSSDQITYLKDMLNHSAPLMTLVISWALENLPLIEEIQHAGLNDDFFFITYEDLLLDPEHSIESLGNWLNLEEPEKIYDELQKPSSTVKYSEQNREDEFFENYDRNRFIQRWKQEVQPETEKEGFEVMEQLGIDIYAEGKQLPKDRYRIKNQDLTR